MPGPVNFEPVSRPDVKDTAIEEFTPILVRELADRERVDRSFAGNGLQLLGRIIRSDFDLHPDEGDVILCHGDLKFVSSGRKDANVGELLGHARLSAPNPHDINVCLVSVSAIDEFPASKALDTAMFGEAPKLESHVGTGIAVGSSTFCAVEVLDDVLGGLSAVHFERRRQNPLFNGLVVAGGDLSL